MIALHNGSPVHLNCKKVCKKEVFGALTSSSVLKTQPSKITPGKQSSSPTKATVSPVSNMFAFVEVGI